MPDWRSDVEASANPNVGTFYTHGRSRFEKCQRDATARCAETGCNGKCACSRVGLPLRCKRNWLDKHLPAWDPITGGNLHAPGTRAPALRLTCSCCSVASTAGVAKIVASRQTHCAFATRSPKLADFALTDDELLLLTWMKTPPIDTPKNQSALRTAREI